MAALGISIIAPTSSLSTTSIFESRNSSLQSSSTAIKRRSSSSPEIIGNMIFTLPTAKIDLGCEHTCTDGCARDFDHCANLEPFDHNNFRVAQLFFAVVEHGDRAAQFIQPRDHRKHDLYVADGTGTQDCTQLRLENLYVLKTKADCAPDKKRI